MSAILVFQPAVTLAGDPVALRADPNAATANQPGITSAANGVPLVNIATPNGAGLSYNKYGDFNVGIPGLILNNSNQELSQSLLGGFVSGNTNLRTSGPASVILNEVTGSSRSVLQGTIEVNGRPADVIIANQNGLTCDGCGFVNAPRVTLSTGAPVIGADGSLSSLRVEGGDIVVGVNGANAITVNVFDLVSRTASINGPVAAGGDLNVIAGRNSVAYQSGLVTPLGSDGKEPGIAIDSSAVGGMYAGTIKLISTDKGAGVNMAGAMAANTAGMTLTADGRLTLGKAQAKGAITARSVSDSVSATSTLFSNTAIVLQGLKSVDLADDALVASAGDVTLSGQSVTLGQGAVAASGTDQNGQQTANGTLSVQATTLSAGNGLLAGSGLLSITAANIDVSRASDTGQDSLRSLGSMVLATDRINSANARITANADITVRSDKALTVDGGTYVAGTNLLVAAASLTSSASLGAQGTASVSTSSGNLANDGAIAGNATTTLTSAGNLTNTGRIVSIGSVTLAANGNLSNAASGLVAAAGDVTVTAATLDNAGTIGAAQSDQPSGMLNVTTTGNLTNSGTMVSLTSAAVTSAGNLTTSGEIAAAGDVNVAVSGTLGVTGSGQLLSQGVMTLTGNDGGMMGGLNVGTYGLINGGAGLGIRSASLTNAGQIGSVYGPLIVQLTGDLTNTGGLLYSGTSSTYQLDGTFTNTNGDVIAENSLVIQGLSGTYATALNNASGTIEAVTGDMGLAASSITNRRIDATVASESSTDVATSITDVNRLWTQTIVTTVTTTETDTMASLAGQLLAGHDLVIDAGTSGSVTNSYSLIAANNDITINAASILNEGRDLIQTVATTTRHNYVKTDCHNVLGWGCAYTTQTPWSDIKYDTTSSTIGAIYGTIQADNNLVANVSGYVTNDAVRVGQGQIGLSSGSRALSGVTISGPESSLTSVQTTVTALLGRQAMYEQPADPNAPFLIETRSAFINLSQFLGSVYFLNLIGYDPNQTIKRIGDAYVEYQIIINQIIALTGKRPHGDPTAQIKALYDNAAAAQKQLNLTMGVALTPTQIAGLTKDIVWLEKQTINGQDVLVPRVYLSAQTLADTSPASAQMNAGGVALINTGNLTNSGAISAGNGLGIQTAGNIVNTGGNLFSAGDVVVQAGGDFANRSGTVTGNNVVIAAGGNVANDTAKIRDNYASSSAARQQPGLLFGSGTLATSDTSASNFGDRQQQTGVIGAQGVLVVQAAGDITAQGGQFASGGDMALVAGNNVTLDPLSLSSASGITFSGGYNNVSSTTNVGAGLKSGGDMTIVAGSDLTATGAQAVAGGLLTAVAGRDITLASATDLATSELQTTGSGNLSFISKTEIDTYKYSDSASSVASGFTGGSVEMLAGRDITLSGSSITGQGDVGLVANGNVNLLSSIDTSTAVGHTQTKDSGLIYAPSAGWGFAIGTHDVSSDSTTTTLTNIGSLVGSGGGNVSIDSGGDFTSLASFVSAPAGDVTVAAKTITVTAGQDITTTLTTTDDKFNGLVVLVAPGKGNPLADLTKVNTSITAANKTKDPLAAELYWIAAGMQTATTVDGVVNAIVDGKTQTLTTMQISAAYTVSDTHTEKSSYSEKASGTTAVTAGGTASLTANGGDVTLQGVNIKANDVRLAAASDVNLLSLALNSYSDNLSIATSRAIGANVTFGLDKANNFSVASVGATVSATNTDSQSHTEDQTYAQTTVTGDNSVMIVSGRDANIKGAEVSGKTIDVTVGRDLTIVSDQDTEKQTASQSSQSASASVGYSLTGANAKAINVSLTLSDTNGKASGDYRSVTKQSGLFAGDGGFKVDVTGVTTLTGAALASTADASLNSLKTGALVTSDLQNASSWQAKSAGSGISISTTDLLKDALTGGIQPSLSRNEQGSSSGTAASTIAPGTITILDAATQQMLTSMTPEQAIAAVNRAAAAQNKAADKLTTLSQTLKNQADVAKAFAAASSATASAVDAMAKDIVKYEQAKVKDLDDPTKTPGLTDEERAQAKADANRIADAWKSADLKTGTPTGAALILTQGLTQGILGGILGGNSVMAGIENGASVIASNVIADQVQKALKDAGLNIDPKGHQDATFANILAQAVATGVGAALKGSEGGLASQSVWTADRPKPETTDGK